ncbi:ribonuclease HI family protein [Haloquadratum walsbyi]|jgi:ribonuclease HI|uniref:Ribonuclease H, type 1 n=1 Tax=Haloquadratum walsbyi (strain DSM 16790 / HBSQ001) TaxID=362976 RepID=Q18HI8_HALWD|nr:ribonuclease HI family protein [Haloquadratum walsbyi]CAJ52550.1 ribonuclease H, type 1 [Haloquadratum walsbyi DSM 16790]
MRDTIPEPPTESLSPLATATAEVITQYSYDITTAINAIDDAIPGFGGLFDPGTTMDERRNAIDTVLETTVDIQTSHQLGDHDFEKLILYTDGSSRGNPGPAGAGAVVETPDETVLCRVGRPVGSRTGNNTAEYAALHLGLACVLTRYGVSPLEIRIDSMTVIGDIWQDATREEFTDYRRVINTLLDEFPDHHWTHVVDAERNPADALATVSADIAGLGPGA